jgi:hypothetical protein
MVKISTPFPPLSTNQVLQLRRCQNYLLLAAKKCCSSYEIKVSKILEGYIHSQCIYSILDCKAKIRGFIKFFKVLYFDYYRLFYVSFNYSHQVN